MELKQTKDTAIDKLTVTRGELLELTSNLTDSEQIRMLHTCLVGRMLGSRYMAELGDMLLRTTISWHARGRDDIRDIAQSDKGVGSFTETKTTAEDRRDGDDHDRRRWRDMEMRDR